MNQTHFLRGLCVRFLCPSCATSKQLINKFLLQSHTNQTCWLLFVSVPTLCALINLCNFNRHKWGCYRFCVTGWALEHWLIGYGWIIHLNHKIAAWLCGPCQWLSGSLTSAGDGTMTAEWKWSMLSLLTFLHQQNCNTFFFCQCDWSWLWSSIAFFITNHIAQ